MGKRETDRTRRAKRKEKEKKDKWQSKPEEVYKGGKQPYFTLRKSTKKKVRETRKRIEEKIQKNIDKKLGKGEVPKVLEIGPGEAPFHSSINTAKDGKIYMDIEKSFLMDKTGQKVKAKLGKENLPFKDKAFGPTVINEVLTHVKPENRKKVVDEVARVSDEVMITDRYLEGNKSGRVVNPEEMKKELEKKGFEVEIERLELKEVMPKELLKKIPKETIEKGGYFILHGKKKKEAEK